MENSKHYPTHPGAEHPPIMTREIPLKEYESIKRENAELKGDIADLRDDRKSSIAIIDKLNAENTQLKKEIEFMHSNCKYNAGEIFPVVVENESNTSPKGSYVTNAELCDGEWYNDVTGNEIEENIEGIDYFYRSKVTHWMPLPSAPKEER